MTAQISKDQFTFSLGNQSYIDSAYADEPTFTPAEPRHSVREWFAKRVGALVEWRHHQEMLREMEMMSDRELADIGLNRCDLPRVFDPALGADRPHG